jgi:uncharacterized protein (DUF1330 family)
MRSATNLVLHVLASTVIVAAGGGASAQQAKPAPGYVIAEVDVTDAAAMQKYGEKVSGTLAPFQGHFRYLIRTSNARAVEGEKAHGIVVIAFDTVKQAQDWYDSPAYQAIIPLRQAAAKSRLIIADGIPPQ